VRHPLERAFRDWLDGRAYWHQSKSMSSRGFYKLKPVDENGHACHGRGTTAPWNRYIKSRYLDTEGFHNAAHAWKSLGMNPIRIAL
jgi:hypothetical protein